MKRRKLEAVGQIDQLDKLKGRDGLSAADFLTRDPPMHLDFLVTYVCPSRHRLELPLPDAPPTCPKRGRRMKPII